MKRFNIRFNTESTLVQLDIGRADWYKIKEINESRTLIKVVGVLGSFQRAHVLKFTNKTKIKI
jgi:hypothetical protein